ncbi:MAG TPA: hypothetical protein PLG59_12840 [bacterium]|nr:hypothetical protein [bacterium]
MKCAVWMLVLFAMVSACGGAKPKQFVSDTTNVELVQRNYEIVLHGLRADVCKVSVLGMGKADISYANAIKAIHKKVPPQLGADYQLVNVVEDKTFEFYLFSWKTCTVISADVAILKEPLDQRTLVVSSVEPVPVQSMDSKATQSATLPAEATIQEIAEAICRGFFNCDPTTADRTYKDSNDCAVRIAASEFQQSACPQYSPSVGRKCIEEMKAQTCEDFIGALFDRIPDPPSCARMCGR